MINENKKSKALQMYELAKQAQDKIYRERLESNGRVYNQYISYITRLASSGTFSVSLETLRENVNTNSQWDVSYVNDRLSKEEFRLEDGRVWWDEKVSKNE